MHRFFLHALRRRLFLVGVVVAALSGRATLAAERAARLAETDAHDPSQATAALDVAAGLEASLFAAEPLLLSPSNIDVDHRGRVWVCEVTNYRARVDTRPEGDRILILEDTDGDGRADKQTVYYQGRDVDSALGICVLGNRVIVSCSPNVFVFTDLDGDDKPDKKELFFSNTGMPQHDHSAHAFLFGPDGKLYWNFGNTGHSVHDRQGNPVRDVYGQVVNRSGQPYREGMAFRCNFDGSDFEVLGHNFRNNYELAVDSFGTIWQSDNDDDGNRAVRINYVMQHGNFGYTDEITGASWQKPYLGQPDDVPHRHWHLTDPGVAPTLMITGGGSPTGIVYYEGTLLPARFQNQMIHCDAGPNIVRCYPVKKHGAGYEAEMIDLVHGARDSWFRPSDVCVAPDGSLIVADWYDPGVGGHNMADVEKGRIFRVAPPGSMYRQPKLDLSTIDGAIEALQNPNLAVRYLAWTKLRDAGTQAEPALVKLYQSENSHFRARALWLLSKLPERGFAHLATAARDRDEDLRITAIRAARQLKLDIAAFIGDLVNDPSPRVRRECALALHRCSSTKTPRLWATLAKQYDGVDRWYLEALGIGADGQWDACLDVWRQEVGDAWHSAAGRDIVWRSRARATAESLGKLILESDNDADRVRFFRAFDFLPVTERQPVLMSLLGIQHKHQATIESLALRQLHGADPGQSSKLKLVLDRALDAARGKPEFLELVQSFQLADREPELLELALAEPRGSLSVAAARYLLGRGAKPRFEALLRGDEDQAIRAVTVLGLTQDRVAVELVMGIVRESDRGAPLRSAAAAALTGNYLGEMALLKLVETGELRPELQFAVARVLQGSQNGDIRGQSAKLLGLPESADMQPLPPLAELLARHGDAERGRGVFASTGTCAKCHIVQGQGAEVGPNLTEIGSKLSRDALFESILFPSAGIAQQYESHTLALDDGNVVTGIILNETSDEISVKGADAIVRTFKKSEVTERKKQSVSLMPADLQKLMTADQLVDVVEYLTTLKKPQ